MNLTREQKLNKRVRDHLCTTYINEDDIGNADGTDVIIPLSPTTNATVWVFDSNGTQGKTLPRVKVCNTPGRFSKKNNFVITVDAVAPVVVVGQPAYTAEEMTMLTKWIVMNYEPLVRFWNKEYTSNPVPFYIALQKL